VRNYANKDTIFFIDDHIAVLLSFAQHNIFHIVVACKKFYIFSQTKIPIKTNKNFLTKQYCSTYRPMINLMHRLYVRDNPVALQVLHGFDIGLSPIHHTGVLIWPPYIATLKTNHLFRNYHQTYNAFLPC
jgi:hypothetical protein